MILLLTLTCVSIVVVVVCWYFVLVIGSPNFPDPVNKTNTTCTRTIPKCIWTFWDTEDIPEIVEKCMETWKKHCPDYTITLLTPNTLSTFLPSHIAESVLHLPYYSDTPQRLSDFVRLHMLCEHGGYWLDSSIMLFDSLSCFGVKQQLHKTEYVGYYIEGFTTDKNNPVVENWFMGCVKNSAFVRNWRNEFMRIGTYGTSESYVKHVRMCGINLQNIKDTHYLTMHVAAQVVLQRIYNEPSQQKPYYLEKAEDGPFEYLASNQWDSKLAIEDLADRLVKGHVITPIVKLRSPERQLAQTDRCILENMLHAQI